MEQRQMRFSELDTHPFRLDVIKLRLWARLVQKARRMRFSSTNNQKVVVGGYEEQFAQTFDYLVGVLDEGDEQYGQVLALRDLRDSIE